MPAHDGAGRAVEGTRPAVQTGRMDLVQKLPGEVTGR